jgi:hypothetical protein
MAAEASISSSIRFTCSAITLFASSPSRPSSAGSFDQWTSLRLYTHGVGGLWREHDCPTAAHTHLLPVPARRPARRRRSLTRHTC